MEQQREEFTIPEEILFLIGICIIGAGVFVLACKFLKDPLSLGLTEHSHILLAIAALIVGFFTAGLVSERRKNRGIRKRVATRAVEDESHRTHDELM